MAADDSGVPGAAYQSPYEKWRLRQGIPTVSGQYVKNLADVEVAPWPGTGGSGVLINHDASDESNDCQLLEIPAQGETAPVHHMFEKMVYVVSGFGSTSVWSELGPQSFEWSAGTLFAIPLNARYQHFNASATDPARLLAVTNLPVVVNLYQSEDFVFHCDYSFADRFAGEAGYFSGDGQREGWLLHTNLVPDARALELASYELRGAGGRKIELSMAGNTMGAHISQFPPGTYKKGHRHGPGAHVVILSGQGYTLMWREGEQPQRYDWEVGSLLIPPDGTFHQHFNTGPEPARYLALRYRAVRPKAKSGVALSRLSTRLGGGQIEYEDEDPMIPAMYKRALAQNGVELRMKEVLGA
jgi:mannose-6-phosphate isomerase-like protein (cupin superfamily)